MTNPETLTNSDSCPYEEFIRLSKELQDAEVPTENRVMYYYLWSWWRHPIKRWRQKRALRKLEEFDRAR